MTIFIPGQCELFAQRPETLEPKVECNSARFDARRFKMNRGSRGLLCFLFAAFSKLQAILLTLAGCLGASYGQDLATSFWCSRFQKENLNGKVNMVY